MGKRNRGKQALGIFLAGWMAATSVDISALTTYAAQAKATGEPEKTVVITEFEPLADKIAEQTLKVGASEKEIVLPDTLDVWVSAAVEETETGETETETEAETETETETETATATETESETETETATATETEIESATEKATETETTGAESVTEEGTTTGAEDAAAAGANESGTETATSGKTKNDAGAAEASEQSHAGAGNSAAESSTPVTESAQPQSESTGSAAPAETAQESENGIASAAEQIFAAFLPMKVYAAEMKSAENEKTEATAAGTTKKSPSQANAESEQPEQQKQQKQLTLTDITWKLNAKESDGDKFDSSKKNEGKCYVYEPVLPETDADGNKLVMADDAELPQIAVLIGGRKVRALSNEVIDIADVEPTGSNGQIVINSENLDDWDNKILTGSVSSSDLNDSAKGIVVDGVTLNLTIRDLKIDRKNFGSNSISAISLINQATLNLTLEGDNSLYGAYGGAGIGVPSGTVLHITQESSGSLYAKGGNMFGGAAGIGAISPGLDLNYSSNPQTRSCGYIKIAGGTVKAEGGTYRFRGSDISGGAGIGGSYGTSGGMIDIIGGSVTAIGGMFGAGIGGGGNGSVARITIDGGTVVAEGTGKGARQPAAIGRGVDTNTMGDNVLPCGVIALNGGNVTAKGNIGYGYVESDYYPTGENAKVTVSDQVFLTLDGEIKDGGRNTVKNYELSFTVFDTAFAKAKTAKIELDGSLVQEKIVAKMTMPGQVAFTLSFAHNAFSGEKTFTVTIDGKTYEATADFKADQMEYDLTAGKELYPVSLEFYDDAIKEDVAVDEISIKQNGTALEDTEFVQPGKIERVTDGVGKMMIFLPANDGATEITVNASGINGSKAMTKTGLMVGKDGITTVSMCVGRVTLSAKESKVNATDVTISVESNVMTWDLYMKRSNDQVIDDPKVIISEGTKYEQTAQKGEVHLQNLTANCNYGFYMVAKQGDLISEIVDIHFNTPNGARVFWEKDSSIGKKYYEGFFNAIADAENISPAGFTIQAMGIANWGSWLTLKKSCKLDLNGQNVTMNGTSVCSLALAEGVSAVLTDSAGGAEYHNSTTGGSYSLFNMKSNSSLTIQGGSYYDYKELLKGESESNRTLTIEGGSFRGSNHIDIGDGKVVLSGGTFYGGLSVSGSYEIKEGYCVKYLTGSNQGTYTTTLPSGKDDVEIVPLPALKGELDLQIGNGISSSAKVGTELRATFTDKSDGDGAYIYTWYRVDGDQEEVIQTSSSATTWKYSTYSIKQADIRKQIYCKVTKEKTSGSIKSEKTYPVMGYSIEGATITLQEGTWRYDGTEQKPKVTKVMLSDGFTTLTQNVSYSVSYENNIHAGTAKVIITGIGIYEGTAETTFTINPKAFFGTDLKIEIVGNPDESPYEYTGAEICPEIVVKDGDQTIPESQYTVSYKNNVNPGTAIICIKGTDDGDYYFGANNNYKYFTIVHDHDWTYSANAWTILMECQKEDCPQRRATIVLYVDDYDPIKYNGKTQDVATVSQFPSGIYPGKITKEYTGDGLENGLPKNAGSYTATMSIEEGGVTYTAKDNFVIEKADTQIGTVTANELQNTLDVDQVQLSRTDTTIPGTLKLKTGTTLQYGTHDYDWVFEPEDSVNYETLDGTVSITVKDTIAPTASWKIGESGWRKFVNTISLGFLCKNTETMEIAFEDAESGVATKRYYIADQEIKDYPGVEWTDYTAPVVLPLGPRRIVYVRVTDNFGNESILNSDGLTVYQESTLNNSEFSYSYKEGQPKAIMMALNGNAFAEVVDDRDKPLKNTDYDMSNDELLTFNPNFLDSLSVGTHHYKIELYPQGNQGVARLSYNITIIVEKAKLRVTGAIATGRTYDGSRLVDVTDVVLENQSDTSYSGVSVDTNGLRGTLEKADAGTYRSVTLPTLTLTGAEADSYELIQPNGPVDLWRGGVTISKKAAPVIQTVDKSYVYTKDVEEAIDLTQYLPADCGEAVFGPWNHGSRGYEYYKVLPKINGNILSYTAGKTTPEQMNLGKRGELVIPVQMTNYEDTEIKFTLCLRDQTNVILKPGMEVRLKNNVLTYGEPLSKLIFEEAIFTDEAGNVIEGTFGWPDGSWVPYAGIPVGTWQFKPADAEYKSVYGSVDIVVNQATPTVGTPASVAERTYDPTKALEDSDLTGGVVTGVDGTALDGTWSWKQSGIVPTVKNSGYEAVFTETGTKNYKAVSTTVAVKVKKAEPVIVQNPTAAEITWGESLADSALSGGAVQHSVSGTAVSGSFAWKDATVKPNVADSNQTAYTVVFTPDDTDNYEITETTVTLNIRRAGNTPNLPANQMDVTYGNKKVKDVQLPDGWEWADADLETELVVGTAVHATAVYIGEGHGNYETESVVIAITRLACTHANTEVRDAKTVSCGVNGYTGDTYCKDCGILLQRGKTVAALTHDYRETYIQQPTDYADGYKIYTCSHCGNSYTVDIPRESGSGNGTGSGTSAGNGNGGNNANGGSSAGGANTGNGSSGAGGANTGAGSSGAGGVTTGGNGNGSSNASGGANAGAVGAGNGATGGMNTGSVGGTNAGATGGSGAGSNGKPGAGNTTGKSGAGTGNAGTTGTTAGNGATGTGSTGGASDGGTGNAATADLPYLKSDSSKRGWDAIEEILKDANEGDTIVIKMNGTDIVPASVLNQAAGKDITVVFELDDGTGWSIHGKELTKQTDDLKLSAKNKASAWKEIADVEAEIGDAGSADGSANNGTIGDSSSQSGDSNATGTDADTLTPDGTDAAADGSTIGSNAENSANRLVILFAIGGIVIAAGAGTGIVLLGGKRRKRGNGTKQ